MIVSFDFDDTLTLPVERNGLWTCSLIPYTEVIARLRFHQENNATVCIVTTRFPDKQSDHNDGVLAFLEQMDIAPHEVIYTKGKFKAPTLKEMGVDLHYDDDPLEVEQCQENDVHAVQVLHPMDVAKEHNIHTYWLTAYADPSIPNHKAPF